MNNQHETIPSDTDDENIHDRSRKLSFSLSRYEWKFYLKEILFLFVEPVSCSRNHKRRGTTASSFASSIVNNLATQPCELVLR